MHDDFAATFADIDETGLFERLGHNDPELEGLAAMPAESAAAHVTVLRVTVM